MALSLIHIFRRADGSVNEQEYADWTKPFVHVDGNLGQDSLQQVQVRTLPAVCVQVLNSKIEELKWTCLLYTSRCV